MVIDRHRCSMGSEPPATPNRSVAVRSHQLWFGALVIAHVDSLFVSDALFALIFVLLTIEVRGWLRALTCAFAMLFAAIVLFSPTLSTGMSMYPTSSQQTLSISMPFAYGLRVPFTRYWPVRWASPADGQRVITMPHPSLADIALSKRVCNTPSMLLDERMLERDEQDQIIAAVNQSIAQRAPVWVKESIPPLPLPPGAVRRNMAIRTVQTGQIVHQVLHSQAAEIDESVFESLRKQRSANQILLCGDNRIYSNDSRYFGAVDQDLINRRHWFSLPIPQWLQ